VRAALPKWERTLIFEAVNEDMQITRVVELDRAFTLKLVFIRFSSVEHALGKTMQGVIDPFVTGLEKHLEQRGSKIKMEVAWKY
jgi:hypothetical protein